MATSFKIWLCEHVKIGGIREYNSYTANRWWSQRKIAYKVVRDSI